MLRNLLLGTALVTLGAASANATIIDLFNNPYGQQQPVTILEIKNGDAGNKAYTYDPLPGGATPDNQYLGSIIGNRRIHELIRVNTPPLGSIFSSRSIISNQGPFPGVLQHEQDSTVITRTVLTYDNLGANGTALDGDGFQLEVAFADHDTVWSLEVKDKDNDSAKVIFGTGTPGNQDLLDGFVFVPFTAFLNGTGCGPELNCHGTANGNVNFNAIISIQFVANADDRRALNAQVGSIMTVSTTVPEPASMTLLGAGLAGLGLLARRRRKSA